MAVKKPKKKAPARKKPAKKAKTAPVKGLSMSSTSPSFTVGDIEKSLAWYRDVLGFGVEERWEQDGKLAGVMVRAGDVRFMLGQDDWKKGRDRKKGEGFRLYCETKQNVDALAEKIKAEGRHPRRGAARRALGGAGLLPDRSRRVQAHDRGGGEEALTDFMTTRGEALRRLSPCRPSPPPRSRAGSSRGPPRRKSVPPTAGPRSRRPERRGHPPGRDSPGRSRARRLPPNSAP